jgi:hypothetical protein
MKTESINPLEDTPFPNRDVMHSFMEIGRNFLDKRLYSNTLPYNRMVRIVYHDGEITSNDICSAMIHSCRKFGIVALVETEINFLSNDYDNVVSLTYNRIFGKDFDLDLENPIKSIIVKDYESNKAIHGEDIEEDLKVSFQRMNFKSSYDGDSFIERRNLYPCFFLIN